MRKAVNQHPTYFSHVVDQVAGGSPAQQGGLAAGDRVLQFGAVSTDLASLAKCMAVSRMPLKQHILSCQQKPFAILFCSISPNPNLIVWPHLTCSV